MNYDVYGEDDIIATAKLSYEGDLTWIGYTFPFGATYIGGLGSVTDIELVPVYVTDVDSIQWQLYE